MGVGNKGNSPNIELPTVPLQNLLRGRKILVVDDNSINLKVASGALRKYGAEVDCVDRGKRAIHKLFFHLINLMPVSWTSRCQRWMEGRNQLNLAFNQASMLQNGHGTFDGAKDSKMTLEKPGIFCTIKPGVPDVVHPTHNGLQNPATKASHVSSQLTPSKDVASHVNQQGLPISVAPSNLAATQGFHALSLLSTSSWGPCDPEPSIPHHSMHRNDASLTQPLLTMDTMPLGGGQPIRSELWHSDPNKPLQFTIQRPQHSSCSHPT